MDWKPFHSKNVFSFICYIKAEPQIRSLILSMVHIAKPTSKWRQNRQQCSMRWVQAKTGMAFIILPICGYWGWVNFFWKLSQYLRKLKKNYLIMATLRAVRSKIAKRVHATPTKNQSSHKIIILYWMARDSKTFQILKNEILRQGLWDQCLPKHNNFCHMRHILSAQIQEEGHYLVSITRSSLMMLSFPK